MVLASNLQITSGGFALVWLVLVKLNQTIAPTIAHASHFCKIQRVSFCASVSSAQRLHQCSFVSIYLTPLPRPLIYASSGTAKFCSAKSPQLIKSQIWSDTDFLVTNNHKSESCKYETYFNDSQFCYQRWYLIALAFNITLKNIREGCQIFFFNILVLCQTSIEC